MRQFQAGEEFVYTLAFTTDGRSLVAGELASQGLSAVAVRWLDPRTGEAQRTLDLHEDAWRQAVPDPEDGQWPGGAFVSPDGRWVAVMRNGPGNSGLDLWDARTGAWSAVDPGWYSHVTGAVCYSAAGDLLVFATATRGGRVRSIERLDLSAGRRLPAIHFRHRRPAEQLRLSADERLLAVELLGGVAVLPHDRGRAAAGKPVELTLDGRENAVEFSPGGEELAVRADAGLLLWDCRSPAALAVPVDRPARNALAYAPDGRLLALSCGESGVLLLDRHRLQPVRRYDWRIGPITSLAFAPDGLTLAAGGEGGRVIVWDVDG